MNALRMLVVGVGQMGAGMAHRCIDAGFEVRAHDIRASAAVNFSSNQLSVHTFDHFVATLKVALLCLVDADQIRAVLFGEPDAACHFHHGLARKLPAGSAVIITSTISVADMRAIGERLIEMGLLVVDAPVSGGPVRARDGSMSMMLAAGEGTLSLVQPVLDALSDAQTVLGTEPGAATTAKLLNNALAAAHLHNHAQALAAAARLGLSPELLHRVVDASSGQSWIGAHRGKRYLAADRQVHARLALLAKDSALALDLLKSQELPTDWLTPAAQAFAAACECGWQDRDDSELIEWLSTAALAAPG